MGNENQISLRSKRKPGYSWVDNEISTCYQAIVGPDATWVYHNLARQVQEQDREPSVTFALRDMAAWTGRSKDTVQRCLAVLELVGLIAVRRGAKAKAHYDLLDVKELVLAHGGVYDVRRSSFVLPEASVTCLKSAVKELRVKMMRKKKPLITVPVNRPVAVSAPASSVAQSDRLTVDNLFLPATVCDSFVALGPESVAPVLGASSCRKEVRSEEKNSTPLPPEKARGEMDRKEHDDASKKTSSPDDLEKDGVQTDEIQLCERGNRGERNLQSADLVLRSVAAIEVAIDQVMHGCGFVRRRLRITLKQVLQREADKGTHLNTAALAMIGAWKRQVLMGDFLTAHYGPEKFFGLGIWDDERKWHWDKAKMERLRLQSEARVGGCL
jgi:hypothetical protein